MKKYLGAENIWLESTPSTNDLKFFCNNNIIIGSLGFKFGNSLQNEINSFDDTQIAVVATTGEIDWQTHQTFTGGISLGDTTAFKLPVMTTAERLALSPRNGWAVYDTDNRAVMFYSEDGGGHWYSLNSTIEP